jgi:hypothetical protein
MSGLQGNSSLLNINKISIKKQNRSILEPYSIDGGSTVYDTNNVYVFKGGSINTLGEIFDLTLAGTIGLADTISFNGNSYYKKTGGFIPGISIGWRDQNSVENRSNTVIAPGTLIYFNPRSYKTTAVKSGAIIEKYNSLGKVLLRPTCGYQNRFKLKGIDGDNAPIGGNFNHIAFDYSSFASNCSSLGFDPATILNSLNLPSEYPGLPQPTFTGSIGEVDFSYHYIVIRAKTYESLGNDLISDLGNGIINIRAEGRVTKPIKNFYKFFVMCKTGWKIVRFYGTDYPI